MIFKIDTDAVRGMVARFRTSAGRMESSLTSIRQTVSSAPWQSQAREDYIQQLELLHNSTLRSAEILSLMGTATEQKAKQWEAIRSRFNAPRVAVSSVWNQLKSMLGWVWSRIKDAFERIRLPSVSQFVGGTLVGVGAFTFSPLLVVGGLYVINPDWFREKPLWWPFTKNISTREAKKVIEEIDQEQEVREPVVSVPKVEQEKPVNRDLVQSYNKQYDGSNPAPGTEERPWVDINAPLQNSPNDRDPDIYSDVIDQFAVETNVRYENNQQGKGETYCNNFVWDVTKAMGVEIPHWVDKNGNSVPQGKGSELSANGTINWLEIHGFKRGWKVVSAEDAQALANLGKPVVAGMKNPTGIGHVAMVRPGEHSTATGPHLAQAGKVNSGHKTANDIFGNREVVYYYHD